MQRVLGPALIALCAAALGGCLSIPPAAAPPTLRDTAPLDAASAPAGTSAASAEPGLSSWPQSEWWRAFDDPDLDTLIERAHRNSPDLAAAQARIESARAAVRSAAALAGVHVDASGDYARERLSDNGLIPPRFLGFHWYDQADLGLSVAYSFDWWGRQRAEIDSALDSARAATADRIAAEQLLTTAVAEAYFGWQADQAQIDLAHELIANLEQQRALAQARLDADIARIDPLQQVRSAVSRAQEQLAQLQHSASLRRVVLASLLAIRPEQLPPLHVRALPALPLGLPADARLDLIARRADIQASRWRVEAAARGVAAARAGFYPDISLHALLGLSSINLSRLLEAGSSVPQIGGAVHLPLFDAGALRGRYDASQARLRAAVAGYDDAVVGAAREVATAMLTLQDLEQRRPMRAEQLASAGLVRDAAAARAGAGLTDRQPLLLAEEQRIADAQNLLQLDAARLQSELELIRTLGGGYRTGAPP